ncbi:MAG TPA: isoprenylcysteine carboxylmethyltransferase family protein [Vicinamibacterales bacterium]|jgi:protein-S-isoprenylcysteine O-methyltransferase Ste14|nr:isoprenylcysteine carboxylmethyltransferase family protein [Vicinamibacterales bacterium]
MTPAFVLRIGWLAWIVTWYAAAVWSGRTVARPGLAREVGYRLLITAGAFLLFWLFSRHPSSPNTLWRVGPATAWTLAGVGLLALASTWWARIHLGQLWSGHITRKEHHHVVDTGPYAIVRHPIYTGVILAALATAALTGTITALLGFALMAAGFYLKARIEEQFLREQLGAEAYSAYARRVPMLVPFAPASYGV